MKVSRYDASKDVFYDIDFDKLKKEYESIKLTEEEITQKMTEMEEDVAKQVANILGVEEIFIDRTEDDIKIATTKEDLEKLNEKPKEEDIVEEVKEWTFYKKMLQPQ